MAFHSLLVKVPDNALPSPIRSTETIAVGGESFFGHGPSELFYQPPTAFAYVQTYVLCYAEKKRPVFWWK